MTRREGVLRDFAVSVGMLIAAFCVTNAMQPARASSAWGGATLLETDNSGDAIYPDVAMDPSGNAIAVWYESDGVHWNSFASRFVPGVGWTTPTMLQTDNSADAEIPHVAMDSSGNAIAVWWQFNGARWDNFASRYVPGVGWDAPTQIESNAASPFAPSVAVDTSGEAIAVWVQSDGVRPSTWANRFVPGAGWGGATLLETDNAGDMGGPRVAVDPSGDAFVVWMRDDGISSSIWANRFVPGVGWGTATLIQTSSFGASGQQIAVDPSGNAIAVWQRWDGSRNNIWASRFAVGAGWGTPVQIEADSANGMLPQIAMDSQGNAIAVWAQGPDIWANRFTPGVGWGSAAAIETDPGGAGSPQVAMAPGSVAFAVWQQSDGVRSNMWASRYRPGLGWGTPALIETNNAGNVARPRVATDAMGNAIAVWQQFDGVRIDTWGNRFVKDSLPPDLVITSPTVSLTRSASLFVAGRTEPGAAVTVAGTIVAVAPDGSFGGVVLLVEGSNSIPVTATDAEGNVATVPVSIRLDSISPALAITSPPNGAILNTSVVHVTGTTSDGGSGVAQLAVNGILLRPAASWSMDLAFSDGPHLIAVTSSDVAGNTAGRSVTVAIDTVAPSLILIAPSDGLTNQASLPVTGITEAGTNLTVNGAATAVDASGAFSTSVSLVEGSNTITVLAMDPAGNTKSLQRIVTRDSTPPALSLTEPSPGLATNSPTILVSGTTEPGAVVLVNGIVFGVASAGTFDGRIALANGPNTITVTATDAAGNSATLSRTVTYSDPLPDLERDLRNAQSELTQTQASLNSTNQQLQDSRQSLDRSNANLAVLGTELSLGMFGAVVALVALQVVFYRRLRREMPPKTAV